jgi:preprotein translocase subunit SecE
MAMSVEETQSDLPVTGSPQGPIQKLKNYYHDVVVEMKKVSWPTRQETINTTIVVIIAVFFFGFFLFGTDIVLSYVIQGIEWAAGKLFL